MAPASNATTQPVEQRTGSHVLDADKRTCTRRCSPCATWPTRLRPLTQPWRILHITAGTSRIGEIPRAGPVLTHLEHGHAR